MMHSKMDREVRGSGHGRGLLGPKLPDEEHAALESGPRERNG